jgi:hypothetical protein
MSAAQPDAKLSPLGPAPQLCKFCQNHSARYFGGVGDCIHGFGRLQGCARVDGACNEYTPKLAALPQAESMNSRTDRHAGSVIMRSGGYACAIESSFSGGPISHVSNSSSRVSSTDIRS